MLTVLYYQQKTNKQLFIDTKTKEKKGKEKNLVKQIGKFDLLFEFEASNRTICGL